MTKTRKTKSINKKAGKPKAWEQTREKKRALAITPATSLASLQDKIIPYDEHLLERSHSQWIFGDWNSLAQLDEERIRHHPERAKLALLAATGHFQSGNTEHGRKFVWLARDWNCDATLIKRILIAGADNSLGRSASLLGQDDRAAVFFNASIRIGAPGTDDHLVTQARITSQRSQLGLPPSEGDRAQTLLSRPEGMSVAGRLSQHLALQPRMVPPVLAGQKTSTRFILLETKSLPRSGLHYLKESLQTVLGHRFSFCEWYQEPGCCKKMPCILNCFAEESARKGRSGLRMIKSHDFDLTDSAHLSVSGMQRVIIVRDPLYILTSYYMLETFVRYVPVLRASAIEWEMLFYKHEPAVVAAAQRCVERVFTPPSSEELGKWLSAKIAYISRFAQKWAGITAEMDDPRQKILRYEDIPRYVLDVLGQVKDDFTPVETARYEAFVATQADGFRARSDPFKTPVPKLTAWLQENAEAFRVAAAKIHAADTHGIFVAQTC